MIQDIAPHQYDVTYRTGKAKSEDKILIYRNNALLCRMKDRKLQYPQGKDIERVCPQVYEKAKFLFRIDDTDYYEVRSPEIDTFDDWEYVEKAKLEDASSVWLMFAAFTGFQIHDWYTNTRFCGRCGEKMEAKGDERAMKCPVCGKVYYPQICPGVIVGVTDGDEILMTRYTIAHSDYRGYALIAGYSEVGESLEDTVRREVLEEVGVKVKNIRYYSSQPWSYSDTLLVGFFCDIDGDKNITVDEEELEDAEWVHRSQIPDDFEDPSISLTDAMMKAFKEGTTEGRALPEGS